MFKELAEEAAGELEALSEATGRDDAAFGANSRDMAMAYEVISLDTNVLIAPLNPEDVTTKRRSGFSRPTQAIRWSSPRRSTLRRWRSRERGR